MDLGTGIGSEQQGVRPCICISNDINNVYSTTVQLIPLTTQVKTNIPSHYILLKSRYPFLKQDSVVLTEQITTKSILRIKKFLGRIEEQDMNKIAQCLLIQLGLDKNNLGMQE